jgi:hypothetical protein
MLLDAAAAARRETMQDFAIRHRERRKSAALAFAALLISVLTVLSISAEQYQLLLAITAIVALVVRGIFSEPPAQAQSAKR